MQNTTESPAMAGGLLPPPLTRAATPPNEINQGPRLPTVVAMASPVATPSANPFATSLNPATPAFGSPRPAPSGGGFRRFISWTLLLAALGGLAYGGVVYGPELMDRVTGDEEIDESSLPLVFPTATAAAVPVQSATFTVETRDAIGTVHEHTVSADFGSGLTQVMVDRGDVADLEILSIWDQSFVRTTNGVVWFQMPRGDFPVDLSMGKSRWIRTLDEVLPVEMRSRVTIERATESVVGNEPTTRLLVSVDPRDVTPVEAPVAAANPATSADFAAPVSGAVVPVLPPGMRLVTGATPTEPLSIELWVDSTGLVRKIILPTELGGETITVTEVSANPFDTPFPGQDVIQPMTSEALFSLGL